MNKEELLEEYESGRLDSVSRLMNVRSHLRRATGKSVPQRPSEVREWWQRNKSVVAKRLRGEDVDDDDDAEESEDGDTEQ